MSFSTCQPTKQQKRLIEELFSPEGSGFRHPLHLLLTCAICGHFKALNDMIEHDKVSAITLDELCQTITKDNATSKLGYYSEMSHKMITHCLLDTLLYTLDVKWIKQRRKHTPADQIAPSLKEQIILEFELEDDTLIRNLDNCYKDSNESILHITAQKLEYGINIYQRLINKFPVLQFKTTFCRYLPHVYASLLLEETEKIEFWQKDIENDGSYYAKYFCPGPFEDEFKTILQIIYNRYATFTNEDGEIIMSWKDLQNYIKSCGVVEAASSERRVRSIIRYNKSESQDTTDFFMMQSFFHFYMEALRLRPEHVENDIIFQGLGEKLCQSKENLSFLKLDMDDTDDIKVDRNDDDGDGNYDYKEMKKIYQMRCEFVAALKKTFVSRELILIKYMIKKSNMQDIFDKINNDIENIILKMLHPLNIDEKNYQFAMLDEKLKSHWKYAFDAENTKDFFNLEFHLLHQPYFYNMIKDYVSRFYKGNETIDKVMQRLKQTTMNAVKFRQHCQSLIYHGWFARPDQLFVPVSKVD